MRTKKRIDKKRHRLWLEMGIVDASQRTHWREKLFSASFHDWFYIDSDNCDELDDYVIRAIKRYRLRYRVSKVPNSDVQYWLKDTDLVVFKFCAVDYPSVFFLTANNPKIA